MQRMRRAVGAPQTQDEESCSFHAKHSAGRKRVEPGEHLCSVLVSITSVTDGGPADHGSTFQFSCFVLFVCFSF